MGRWIVLEEDDFVRDNSDGWCGSCASEDDAKNIARRHKQECDHYEQRIAELTAELARVKAESLRVVPVGDECAVLDLVATAYFTDEDKTYRKTGVTWGDAGPEYCSFEELVTDGTHGQMSPGFIVQPIRLELWDRQC